MEYCTVYNKISECEWRHNNANSCESCSYKIKANIDLCCNSCDAELISDDVDWYNGDTWICSECDKINEL